MNPTATTAISVVVAISMVVGAFSMLPLQTGQNASAANVDSNNVMLMRQAHAIKGQIASVQLSNATGQPEWIQSGIWLLRVFSPSNSTHIPDIQLVARFTMVKTDGTSMHMHKMYNFKATEMVQEGNSTSVLKGTTTVTMKDGPVSDVCL